MKKEDEKTLEKTEKKEEESSIKEETPSNEIESLESTKTVANEKKIVSEKAIDEMFESMENDEEKTSNDKRPESKKTRTEEETCSSCERSDCTHEKFEDLVMDHPSDKYCHEEQQTNW